MKEFLRRIARTVVLPFRPTDVSAPAVASPLLAAIDPTDLLPSEALLRLGTAYGGWIIPLNAKLDADSICYLAGAGEDISFDCALVQRFGCQARIIDPTPRAIDHFRQLAEAVRNGLRFPVNNSAKNFYDLTPQQLTRLTFLPIGLADRDVELKFFLPKNPAHVSCSTVNLQKTNDFFTAQCHRLATVMAQQGDNRIDLLKMDIEGGEYVVISDLVESGLLPQLLLIEFDETHTPLDANACERIAGSIRLLTDAGMACVAVDGSNATFVRSRRKK
jgi:FkbM family methyltransferase